jgi:hypothetical protein
LKKGSPSAAFLMAINIRKVISLTKGRVRALTSIIIQRPASDVNIKMKIFSNAAEYSPFQSKKRKVSETSPDFFRVQGGPHGF